jgi:hypothetical protein
LVVKNLLDDVRLHAEIRHPRGDASPDIVHRPSRHARAFVECAFAMDPTDEAVAAHTGGLLGKRWGSAQLLPRGRCWHGHKEEVA